MAMAEASDAENHQEHHGQNRGGTAHDGGAEVPIWRFGDLVIWRFGIDRIPFGPSMMKHPAAQTGPKSDTVALRRIQSIRRLSTIVKSLNHQITKSPNQLSATSHDSVAMVRASVSEGDLVRHRHRDAHHVRCAQRLAGHVR